MKLGQEIEDTSKKNQEDMLHLLPRTVSWTGGKHLQMIGESSISPDREHLLPTHANNRVSYTPDKYGSNEESLHQQSTAVLGGVVSQEHERRILQFLEDETELIVDEVNHSSTNATQLRLNSKNESFPHHPSVDSNNSRLRHRVLSMDHIKASQENDMFINKH